jgi:PAS domain-containing protein
MTDQFWGETAILAAICLFAALVAVVVLAPRQPGSPRRARPSEPLRNSGPVFLFDGASLADASADPAVLFGDAAADGFGWRDLYQALIATYPTLPAAPELLHDGDRHEVAAASGLRAGPLTVERIGTVTRVVLAADSLAPAAVPADQQSELDTLRLAMDSTPFPVWRMQSPDRVGWHNAAYGALARRLRGRDADPGLPLFDTDAPSLQPGRRTRVAIELDDHGHKMWFEVTLIRQPAGDLYCATDINAVVDAEIAQRNFVQTLAKTFAQLSIGLAIFDRNRQLALFNPALIDLTALPADFLSSRPTLLAFFDRLRDQKMMPEPRDYHSWRQRMADLVAAAADGSYRETWSLPSGSVYSVSGRPHPDGAVAFLIEDITAEVTLTRRFRAELEIGQAVLDRLDDAVAVFAPDGVLVFSNQPFNRLWGVDPDRSFAQVTVIDMVRTWHGQCAISPIWGELRDFVAMREGRGDWWAEVQLRSGRALNCGVHPILNGATMVRFCAIGPDPVDPVSPPAETLAETLAETATV